MSTSPCPLCKQPIELPAVNGSTVACAICLHEFVVRAGRLSPQVDLEGLDVPILQPDEPAREEPRRGSPRSSNSRSEADRVPSRRTLTREKKPASRVGAVLAMFGAALVIIGIVLAANWPRSHRKPAFVAPKFDIPAPQAKFDILAPAAALPPLPTHPADAATDQEVRRSMSGVFDIVRARDRVRFVNLFDYEKLVDRVAASQVAAQHHPFDRVAIRDGFRLGVENDFHRERLFSDLNVFEVHSVRTGFHIPNLVEVVTRSSKDGRGVVVHNRFWLIKQGEQWKIVDFEDIDMNARMSHFTSPLSAMAAVRIDGRLAANCTRLREAMRLAPANIIAAENELVAIEGPLPGVLESANLFANAVIEASRQRNAETLRLIERARRFHNDSPAFDSLEASTLAQFDQHDRVIKLIEAYRTRVGDDAQVCDHLGLAYRHVNRRGDAVVQFRKSLDYDPRNSAVLVDLLETLGPGETRDDLGRRFLLIDNRAAQFEPLVMNRANAPGGPDWRAIEQLAGAMLSVEPNHTLANYQMALAKIQRFQGEQAMAHLKKALAGNPGPKLRKEYTDRVTQELSNRQMGWLTYDIAPDRVDAFRRFGGELITAHRTDELANLVARHRKAHRETSVSIVFEAVIAGQRGEHEKSETLFAKAEAGNANEDPTESLTPGIIAATRPVRRLNLYRLGKVIAAYRDIGPRNEAFTELSIMAWNDLDAAALKDLVDAQTDFNESHDALPMARRRLALLTDDADRLAVEARGPSPNRAAVVIGLANDALAAGKAVAAYQALRDDPRAAIVALGFGVLHDKPAELKQILALHRKSSPDDPWLDYFEAELLFRQGAKPATVKAAASLVTAAYRRADAGARPRMQMFLVDANIRAERWHDAFREVKNDRVGLLDLARQLAATRRWDHLELLLEQHPPGGDPDLRIIAASLAIARNDLDAARFHYHVALMNRPANQQMPLTRAFTANMTRAGHGALAYRFVGDRATAFATIIPILQQKRQWDEIDALLREHDRFAPGDPAAEIHRGELLLERNDPVLAQAAFQKALASDHVDTWRCETGLRKIRVKKGEALKALAESDEPGREFASLAWACVQLKDGKQLEQLIAARRKLGDSPDLSRWDLHLLVLKKDDEAIVKTAARMRAEKVRSVDAPFLSDTLVRALVRLKKHDEAVHEAETQAKTRFSDKLPLVLAHAAQGDVAKTIESAESFGVGGQFRLYNDADLGPLLRQDAFAPFRDRFPPPAADDVLFDDFED